MTLAIARGLHLAAAAILASVAIAEAASAASFGLVVGIDHYEHVTSLEGAVNDAKDIASALRGAGFQDVRLLTDGNASRDAILGNWHDLVAHAKPGDTIVFTYAGHGGQEPELVPGSEADGLDEYFALSGFELAAPGNHERIIDNEINELFQEASGLNIVFIADSCHSGTMTRSFDPRAGAGKVRSINYGPIIEDTLPPPSKAAALLQPDDLANVTFFGAVADNQVVTEVAIDGAPRGAMSWAFARAMRGAADRNGDHQLDSAELESYLRETVRTETEGRQLPNMQPRGRPVREIVAIAPSASVPADDGLIRVYSSDPAFVPPPGAVGAVSAAAADLVWDGTNGEVVSAAGDVVARAVVSRGLAGVVAKWQALRALRGLVESRPLSAALAPDASLHHEGDRLDVQFNDPHYSNVVLFDIANDGTVQLIAPGPDPNDIRYNGHVAVASPVDVPVRVTPPFGADHVVALVSAQALDPLVSALRQVDGKIINSALISKIQELRQSSELQAAVVSIITGPRS